MTLSNKQEKETSSMKEKNLVLMFLYDVVACWDSIESIEANRPATIKTIWNNCHRVDWLLWILLTLAEITDKNYDYYTRASAASLSACIDVLLDVPVFFGDDAKYANRISTHLDRFAQYERYNRTLLYRYIPSVQGVLCEAGRELLEGALGHSVSYEISRAKLHIEDLVNISEYLGDDIIDKMCKEIRRVAQPPTANELKTLMGLIRK